MIIQPGTRDIWLILAHGAGGNMNSEHIAALAQAFVEVGLGVVRFNFAYRDAGKSIPSPMPKLISEYQAVVESIQRELSPEKLLIGGHSMGGRVASMLAADPPPQPSPASGRGSLTGSPFPACGGGSLTGSPSPACGGGPGRGIYGLVLLSYPLHPPDKPEKLRVEHLPRIQVPTLCFEGTRDPFCTPDILVSATKDLPHFELIWFEGADHSLHAPKAFGRSDRETRAQIAAKVVSWAEGL